MGSDSLLSQEDPGGGENTAPCELLAFAREEVIMPARLEVVNQIAFCCLQIGSESKRIKIGSSLDVVQEGRRRRADLPSCRRNFADCKTAP